MVLLSFNLIVMPGVYGSVCFNGTSIKDLESMSRAMRVYEHYRQDELFTDGKVSASRVHLGNIENGIGPYRSGHLSIWVQGEVYNLAEAKSGLDISGAVFEACLADAHSKGQLDTFLSRLDGYYCAVIYDSATARVSLISDRYGTRMLYFYHRNGFLAWSSEVKGILGLARVDLTLDETAYDCFMDLGYLMGIQTWFKHIKLIGPATVMDYDLPSDTLSTRHYWRWSAIRPSGLSFDEAVDCLGERVIEAVRRRFLPDGRVAVLLSGGLDSRTILAAASYLHPDYVGWCKTVGMAGCDDIRIATEVAARAKWTHKVHQLDSENWFEPRIPTIWDTDGMYDIKHSHAAGSQVRNPPGVRIVLNGYLGGEALGDSYQKRHHHQALNQRISLALARAVYREHVDRADIEDTFYDISHIEPFHFINRSRRFVQMGTVSGLAFVDVRLPFCDNGIMELLFSIPDDWRLNNKLYSAMLLRRFPKYFRNIPWQKIGRPIGPITSKQWMIEKLRSIPSRLGLPSHHKDFHDYAAWLREPAIQSRLRQLFCHDKSQVSLSLGRNDAKRFLEEHLSGETDRSNQLLRLLTVELYLRRIFSRST